MRTALRMLAGGAAAAALLVLGGVIFTGTTNGSSLAKHPPSATAAFIARGQQVFRYDTFGDQAFWGGVLQLHKAIEGAKLGGVGPGVSPKTALTLGLKVDATKIPAKVAAGIKAGKVDLNSPKTTLALLKLGAVVGVKGIFDKQGRLASMGLTCAVCHSTVDNSFAPGIGRRLDGWPNRDLNVGAIVSAAPNLKPVEDLLGVDDKTLKKVLASWGPGKFDAEVFLDGKAFRPDGKSAAVLIPPAFGMGGINLHTYEGWGSVTYWNAFVANLELHGIGNFDDDRLANKDQFPIAVKAGDAHVRNKVDLITPVLGPLEAYQKALQPPKAPRGSFDAAAARRGQTLFTGKAKCSSCHILPLGTEPGWNLHKGSEICIDDFQADRSPTHLYRTTPLRGMVARMKGGFYHDGRFPTLLDVVQHYDSCMKLSLSSQEQSDLVQFLKSQ
jgi:hypothetical protein